MNNNLPPGCSQSDIDRQFIEEHECQAGPFHMNRRAYCIHCDRDMTDEYEPEDD